MEREVEGKAEGIHVGEVKVHGGGKETSHKMGLGKETFLLFRLDGEGGEKLNVWKFSA